MCIHDLITVEKYVPITRSPAYVNQTNELSVKQRNVYMGHKYHTLLKPKREITYNSFCL